MGRQKERRSVKRKGRWSRLTLWVVLGLVVILLASAAGFYLWFRAQVGASNARVDPAIIEALEESTSTSPSGTTDAGRSDTSVAPSTTEAPPEAPTGMNIVLLGSDTRSTDGKGGRSDTIILLHVDPDNDYLSMLSIPRDLKVRIPGRGTNKINAAYAYGGAALLIRTVQSALGVDLDHYVKVDFTAFKEITDTLGGVYVDVDRTYDDGKIQLNPGYQLLDGQNALRFCRTRHDSNYDFGRMERQQRFLSAVREQVMGWDLAFRLPSLIEATFSNVDTDLGANEILKLAYWAIRLDGGRTKLATIVASTGTIDGVSYVLASDEQITSAVKSFLTPPPVAAARADDFSHEQRVTADAILSSAGLADAVQDAAKAGALPNAEAWQALAAQAGFPLVAPRYLPAKCTYSYQRSYSIQVGDETRPAVKVGYRFAGKDQYLGLSETTWLDAPIASPGKEVEGEGVVFTMVGTSTRTDHIWWVKDDVLHWVANTLRYELSAEQLLAVAVSATAVSAAGPQ